MLVCALLLTGCRSNGLVLEVQNGVEEYEALYNTSDIFDFNYSSSQLLPFETFDELISLGEGVSVTGVFKRPSRASLYVEFDGFTLIKNFRVELAFYDNNKKYIGESFVEEPLINLKYYKEIKFDHSNATFFQIKGLRGELITPSELLFADNDALHEFSKCIKADPVMLAVDRVSNNKVHLYGKLNGNYNAVVQIHNKYMEIIDTIKIDTKDFNFEKFIDFGPCYYSLIITEM